MTASALVTAAMAAQAPFGERIYLALCLVLLGAVLVTMGRMGARRALAPNALFGIRTKRTLSSDRVWYEVHAAAAPWSLAAGVVAFIGIIPVLLLEEDLSVSAVLVGVCASVVVLSVGAVRALRRVAAPGEETDR
ncbi:SdpI family protein [Microbispora hainanensis]|uniref:SdpI family protein n=1 Tax=Microbispora hainanensis TaxID=568844 RepID=UPI0033EDEEA4